MLSQRGGLRVSYLAVSWCLPVQGMPLLIQPFGGVAFLPSPELAAAASMLVEFKEARSHDAFVIGSICGIY